MRFVDERNLCRALENGCRMVVVSGGDAYLMAASFKEACFDRMRRFIDAGGTYIGVCAGAYLPLPTSVEPMNHFNLSSTKISNIRPIGEWSMPGLPRAKVRYCDRMIIHPVRGEVLLSVDGRTIPAPLYGGPIFCEPMVDECVGRYIGPTPRTEFQADSGRAMEMLCGSPAVVRSRFGEGTLMLFGPHLEHPSYHLANKAFLKMLDIDVCAGASRPRKLPEDLRRALADLRVAISGLEGKSFLVGQKMWDSERLMTFTEAISSHAPTVPDDVSEDLAERLAEVRSMILSSRLDADQGIEDVVDSLMAVTRRCVDEAFMCAASSR